MRYPREACDDHAERHPAGSSYPRRAGLDSASTMHAKDRQHELFDSRTDRHSVQENISLSFRYVKLFIFITFCS